VSTLVPAGLFTRHWTPRVLLRHAAANRTATVAAVVLVAIVVVCLAAPAIAPYGPTEFSSDSLAGPSWKHLFGTDQFGRDMLSRVLWGGRLTLLAAVAGVAISVAIGVPLGLAAGYSSRWISSVIMRCMDVLLAFPGLLLALVIVTILGRGLGNVIVAIGVSYIPVFARIVYASTLAARGKEYVLAVRVMGARASRVMGRHILPNVTHQIVVIATSAVGWAMLLAATLNFLGFGVKLPTPEWGADLSAGREWLGPAWWVSTFPGMAIAVTILAVNFVGDSVGGSAIDARTIEEPQQAAPLEAG
jgi:ABC-type dipeptide/oligopeptide/nickel transport system permease subunit